MAVIPHFFMKNMLKFTMKIGPKGQVVIPAVLRKHLKLKPQS
jgi:bifunctional DNA-binding transcriptional regulator/antitoxin component of YhaV-PrlF toxin-antitoxin module